MVLPIILAAGRGTRMHSTHPKALTQLHGKPFIKHVLDTVGEVTSEKPIIVVGYQADKIVRAIGKQQAEYCYQVEQKGTGHALLQTQERVQARGDQTLLVLYADVPLVTPRTLQAVETTHRERKSDLTFLTTNAQNPTGLGRVLAEGGKIYAIVEEAEATPDEQRICRVNTGICCIEQGGLYDMLKAIPPAPRNGEIYLTNLVLRAAERRKRVFEHFHPNEQEVRGINTPAELSAAEAYLAHAA